MFKYSDNPALFVAIYKQYGKRFKKEFQSLDDDCFFTDDELAKIEDIEVDFEGQQAEIPFKNLDGIEKLVNLKKFSYYGKDYDSMRLDIVALDHKRKHNIPTNFLYTKLTFQELIENSQQIDFSGLKNCKDLEMLKIYNAHSLVTLDVSTMPKLSTIQVNTCPNLTTIVGLENLDAIKKSGNTNSILDRFSIFNFILNFDNCPAISNIVNFDKLVEVWQNNYKLFRTLDLATTCFPRLERRYPEAIKMLEQNNGQKDFINWNDYVDSGSKYTISTRQAKLAKERCDEIIRTICRDEDSPIKRVAKIYRWICENITYDHYEDDHPDLVTQKDEERTRSFYRALFDKKAVCVGISNLFNFFCADIGYLAVPCYCGTVKFDSSVVYGDHQMSKMIINGNSYYFDPTWDLGNKTLKYFGLNRDEISANHGLTIDDDNTPNAPSIQKESAQKNYLTEELFDEIPDWLKDAITRRDDQIIRFEH